MRDKNISSFVIGKNWGLIGKDETVLLFRDVTVNVVEKEYLLIEKKRNKLNKMKLPGQDLNKNSNECWQSERNSRNHCDKPHLGQISDSPLREKIWVHNFLVKPAIQNFNPRFFLVCEYKVSMWQVIFDKWIYSIDILFGHFYSVFFCSIPNSIQIRESWIIVTHYLKIWSVWFLSTSIVEWKETNWSFSCGY